MQDDGQATRAGGAGSGLPRDVQEHLGRRLRTELSSEAEKPTFLGESSVPPEFEPLVRKLEAGEQGQRQGYEAVKRAIIGDDAEHPPQEATAPSTPSPRPRIPKRPL